MEILAVLALGQLDWRVVRRGRLQMTIALIIVMTLYLAVATLLALNSLLEAERPALAATDLAVIVLVSLAWPVVGCALLSVLACHALFSRKREFRPALH